jgi:predicted nucleic-acid-binding Zn-ribbon protein
VELKGIWVMGECALYQVLCSACGYRGLYDPRINEVSALWRD